MTEVQRGLNIPEKYLHDDNYAQQIELPKGLDSIPVTSAPYFTLYRLLRYLKPESVLEIGTQAGVSALVMSLAFRDNKMKSDIICVDPFYPSGDNDGLSTLTNWYKNIYPSELKAGIRLILATSSEILPQLNKKFDFVFVDGSHQYEDVKYDCLMALSLLKPGGYFLAHDYVIYESVSRACNEVIEKLKLPHFVNKIQKNYRGDLCGWIIAKKTENIDERNIITLHRNKNWFKTLFNQKQ